MSTLKENLGEFKSLMDIISQRLTVGNVMGMDNDYLRETDKLIKQKKSLLASINKHYEEIRTGRVGMHETLSEYMERMENTLEVDDAGQVIITKYKLGISVIDDEFLNGQGVTDNALIVLGADSGVGKTSLAFMIISSMIKQELPTHFISLEMGDKQLYNEISPSEKNKLKHILNSEHADLLTIDFYSREIAELETTIQIMASNGTKVFVIDSYMNVFVGEAEYQKMEMLSDMLETLKRELGVLFILIAQISKSDSVNEVYEFKGGTQLKYRCDLALFIQKLDGEEESTKRHIHCDKNRIFEEKVGYGIVTDYDRVEHKIVKLSKFKDYNGLGHDKKPLRKLSFG